MLMTDFGEDHNTDQGFAPVNRTLPLSPNSLRLDVVSEMPGRKAIQAEACPCQVVLLNKGPYTGKTATIVEIIDHNRVCLSGLLCSSCDLFLRVAILLQALIDGPTTGVPRQSFPYRHLSLTSFVVPDLPRGSGTPIVKKYAEKAGVDEKWAATSWARKRALVERRKKLTDFERFTVMLEKRKRRDTVRKSLAKKA
jgi:large subunit ribosomal protein L14e